MREKVCPAWSDGGREREKFALLGLMVGVSAKKFALRGLVVGVNAKKFALLDLMCVRARKSSPCSLITPQIRRFCACRAKFFAEMPLEARCWASFFAIQQS